MKVKSSRLYGIVGLALLVLVMFLVLNSEDKVEVKPQTKIATKEVVRLQPESASEVQQTTEFVYELETNPTFPE